MSCCRHIQEDQCHKQMELADSRQLQKDAWAVKGGSEDIADRFHDLVPDKALNFPFELDTFQKERMQHMEDNRTRQFFLHRCTIAVYTVPIKTISSHKCIDFCGKLDVNLLTGDVSLRPEASCLIMTTKILRPVLHLCDIKTSNNLLIFQTNLKSYLMKFTMSVSFGKK